jgi:hypothetical protein
MVSRDFGIADSGMICELYVAVRSSGPIGRGAGAW